MVVFFNKTLCDCCCTITNLATAMKAREQPGLDRIEVLRLWSLIQAASAYQIKIAEFVDNSEHLAEQAFDELVDLRSSQEGKGTTFIMRFPSN